MVEDAVKRRLDALTASFNRAKMTPLDASRLLRGPFSYYEGDTLFTGYSWRELSARSWGVFDAKNQLRATLHAPDGDGKGWTYDLA